MTYTDEDLRLRLAEEVTLLKLRRDAKRIVDGFGQRNGDFEALFLDRADLDNMPQAEPLISEILPRHTYGILRGRDQAYKSFVALDWALCLATGRMWQGRRVERVPVLYIAGEGAYGLRSRVAAWEHFCSTKVEPGWFTARTQALNLHQAGPAFDHLLENVNGRYGLIVVDTLRKVSGTADGNGSDMGPVIDNLIALKQATDAGTVLAIAHTDKGDTDSRGFSGIEDDADFVWHAKRDQDRLSLELTKMKDGPDGTLLTFQAKPVLESVVLVASIAKAEGTTESELKILETMRLTFPDGTYGGALREASGLAKATFYRALGALQTSRIVTNSGSHQRPFYELSSLAGTHGVSPSDSPSDLRESHESHQVPSSLTSLTTLRSETTGTETCSCGIPAGLNLPHQAGCCGLVLPARGAV